MFVKNNRVYYDYNFLDGVHYIIESPELPTGKVDVRFNFIKTQQFGGTGELYIVARRWMKSTCRRCTSAPIHSLKLLTLEGIPVPRFRKCTKTRSRTTANSIVSSSRCLMKTRFHQENCRPCITRPSRLKVRPFAVDGGKRSTVPLPWLYQQKAASSFYSQALGVQVSSTNCCLAPSSAPNWSLALPPFQGFGFWC